MMGSAWGVGLRRRHKPLFCCFSPVSLLVRKVIGSAVLSEGDTGQRLVKIA